jgi:hypothetical protein
MGLDSVTQNWEENRQNKRILGPAYTDELRKSMVPGWDDPSSEAREYHDKYIELARLEDDSDKKQFYLDQARSAYRNAQITKKVNYALGEEPFGYDTSATEGVAAFGEDRPVVDYGGLSGRLKSGLEGTKRGESFLKEHAIPKEGDTDYMKSVISDFNQSDLNRILASTAPDADRLYYQSRPERVTELIAGADAANDEITITDIIEEPYGEEWDIDTGPYNLNPAVPISRQEGLDWDFDSERKMRLYQDQEKDARLMDILEDIGVTSPGGPIEGHVSPYGPTAMDIYNEEEEKRRKALLWGPGQYPDQFGPVDR